MDHDRFDREMSTRNFETGARVGNEILEGAGRIWALHAQVFWNDVFRFWGYPPIVFPEEKDPKVKTK
jgi:hypothetical protein